MGLFRMSFDVGKGSMSCVYSTTRMIQNGSRTINGCHFVCDDFFSACADLLLIGVQKTFTECSISKPKFAMWFK